MNTLQLSLACNNYRNGAFDGLCRAIILGDCSVLKLESPWVDRFLKCAIEGRRFRLGKGHWWPHRGHATWVGNWCWDAVTVTHTVAAEVLNFAARRGYRPEMGLASLWDAIESRRPLTAADVDAALAP